MNHDLIQLKKVQSQEEYLVDLRSDTVTRPTKEMLSAISNSMVGDDVYGDDPTVNELQDRVASLLGKEDALFVTSGTQSNLCAMLAHCSRGEEIITGDKYHVYLDEAGGASVLGSIAIAPITTQKDGSLKADDIEKTIKPDDPHYPISKLLSLENTVSGKVQNLKKISTCTNSARKFGLSTHMDGARLMNAAVKLDVPVKTIVENIDTVSLCLSKGLGAPAGSVLTGPKYLIKKAYRVRKLLGGGMRQAGILASAGLYALDNNIQRLATDHQNAHTLAQELYKIRKINVIPEAVETNMVFIKIPAESTKKFQKYCSDNKILVNVDSDTIRLVTHLDISVEKIQFFVEKLKLFFS